MRGYLFDANHVSAYFNGHPVLMERLRLVTPDLLRVCAITLGEIEGGHEMTVSTNPTRREEYRQFVDLDFKPHALEVSIHTSYYYAQIIGRIWKTKPPKTQKVDTDAHLVQLGVNVNDLWTVAVAWEHGLVFLTEDEMKCITEVVPEVDVQCWL